MKTNAVVVLGSLILSLAGLTGCESDPVSIPLEQTPVLQFTDAEIRISENLTQYKVDVPLSSTALRDGIVSFKLMSQHLSSFQTDPPHFNGIVNLPISKGNSGISLLIKPVNDAKPDGDKILSVIVSGASTGFRIGTRDTLTVVLLDDEKPVDNPVEVNFAKAEVSFLENAEEGFAITVQAVSPISTESVIGLVYSSDKLEYGTDFITEPAAEGTKITIAMPAGASEATFKVIPFNDQAFDGDQRIVFTLTSAYGGARLGQGVVVKVNITDDESAPKTTGYESITGGSKVKRQFEYDDQNRLLKITWEQYSPSYQGGTYTYHYHQGRVHKMVENDNRETYYVWEGDRIVKEEQYTNGLLSKYALYGYDEAGHVGEVAFHYRQTDGSMKMGLLLVYLYFTNGNLYKKMVYTPVAGGTDFSLISVGTYDNYLDIANPFPLEILPNINPQPKLPGSFTEETNGQESVYHFSYEFDSSGRPLKRTATSTNATSITTYTYK